MRVSLRSLLALVALGIVSPMARAVDLADNLSQNSTAAPGFTTSAWRAQGFNTTATDFIVDSITVRIYRVNSFTTGTVHLYIYTATGTGATPGSSVTGATPVATIPHTSIGTISSNYTLSSLNVTLSPSTNYYLLLNAAPGMAGPGFAWDNTSSTSGTGFPSGSSISNDSGTSWSPPSLSNPQKMRITAVPEPSTWALAAVTTGVLAVIARRRKARAAQAGV